MADLAARAPISADEQRLRARAAEAEGPEDQERFLAVLDDTVGALEASALPYVLMGGIAAACHGRPRWTHDVDLLVRPTDARAVLDALAAAGFETEETFPDWLFKAERDGQLVDVIFRSSGDIYLDDEMLARARRRDFLGRRLLVIPPEDLIVIKAVVHAEHMPRHWHDALAVLAGCEDMDWDYLVQRSRKGVRRVLSLLLYAQSNDLVVPWRVIRRLFEIIDDPGEVAP
jgi:hypothetical protein